MRTRADQRERTEQRVEELRYLVDRGLADETANTRYPRIALGDRPDRGRIGLVGVHRAELVDLDDFVVEAMAFLLEEHGSLAVELDGDCGPNHHRRQKHDPDQAEHDVE